MNAAAQPLAELPGLSSLPVAPLLAAPGEGVGAFADSMAKAIGEEPQNLMTASPEAVLQAGVEELPQHFDAPDATTTATVAAPDAEMLPNDSTETLAADHVSHLADAEISTAAALPDVSQETGAPAIHSSKHKPVEATLSSAPERKELPAQQPILARASSVRQRVETGTVEANPASAMPQDSALSQPMVSDRETTASTGLPGNAAAASFTLPDGFQWDSPMDLLAHVLRANQRKHILPGSGDQNPSLAAPESNDLPSEAPILGQNGASQSLVAPGNPRSTATRQGGDATSGDLSLSASVGTTPSIHPPFAASALSGSISTTFPKTETDGLADGEQGTSQGISSFSPEWSSQTGNQPLAMRSPEALPTTVLPQQQPRNPRLSPDNSPSPSQSSSHGTTDRALRTSALPIDTFFPELQLQFPDLRQNQTHLHRAPSGDSASTKSQVQGTLAVVNSPVTGTPSAISNTTALALSSEVVMAVTDAPQTAPPAGGSSPTGVAAIPTLVSTSPMSAPVLEGSRPVQIQPEGPVASDDPHSTTPSASPRSPFSTPNWPTTPAASPDANAATDVAFLPVGTPPSTSSTIGAQTPQTGPSNLKNAPLPKGAPRLVSTPGLAVQGKDYPVTTLPGTLSPAMSSDGSLSDDSLLAPMTPSTESEAGTPAFSTPAKKDSKLAHEPLPTVDQTILAAAMPMVVTPPVIPLVVTVPGEKETASANSASTGTQTPVLQSPLPASQFFSGAKTELSSKASPQPGAAAPYSLSSFGKPSPSPQSTGSPIAGRLDSQKTGAKSSVAPEIARQPSNSATAPVPPVAAEIHVSPDAMAINQATVVPQSELQQTAVTMAESKDSSIETRPTGSVSFSIPDSGSQPRLVAVPQPEQTPARAPAPAAKIESPVAPVSPQANAFQTSPEVTRQTSADSAPGAPISTQAVSTTEVVADAAVTVAARPGLPEQPLPKTPATESPVHGARLVSSQSQPKHGVAAAAQPGIQPTEAEIAIVAPSDPKSPELARPAASMAATIPTPTVASPQIVSSQTDPGSAIAISQPGLKSPITQPPAWVPPSTATVFPGESEQLSQNAAPAAVPGTTRTSPPASTGAAITSEAPDSPHPIVPAMVRQVANPAPTFADRQYTQVQASTRIAPTTVESKSPAPVGLPQFQGQPVLQPPVAGSPSTVAASQPQAGTAGNQSPKNDEQNQSSSLQTQAKRPLAAITETAKEAPTPKGSANPARLDSTARVVTPPGTIQQAARTQVSTQEVSAPKLAASTVAPAKTRTSPHAATTVSANTAFPRVSVSTPRTESLPVANQTRSEIPATSANATAPAISTQASATLASDQSLRSAAQPSTETSPAPVSVAQNTPAELVAQSLNVPLEKAAPALTSPPLTSAPALEGQAVATASRQPVRPQSASNPRPKTGVASTARRPASTLAPPTASINSHRATPVHLLERSADFRLTLASEPAKTQESPPSTNPQIPAEAGFPTPSPLAAPKPPSEMPSLMSNEASEKVISHQENVPHRAPQAEQVETKESPDATVAPRDSTSGSGLNSGTEDNSSSRDQNRDFSPKMAEKEGGMPVAQTLPAMKNAAKQDQFAGRGEQKIPLAGITPFPGSASSTELVPDMDDDRTPVFHGADADIHSGAQVLQFPPSSLPPHLERLSQPAASASSEPVSPAQHVLLEVTRHAVALRQKDNDSLAVVLRPDAGTEIHLQLVQRNGVVEVNARFERGDFQALNTQWSQLQQTLSNQGVRLGPLQDAGSTSFSGSGGGNHHNAFTSNSGSSSDRQSQPERRPREEFDFARQHEQPARSRATRVSLRRGKLETWA